MKDKKNFYNNIANQFSDLKNEFDTIRRKKILIDEFLFSLDYKNKKIIECGCADGYFIQQILNFNKNNNIDICGCDISEKLLKIANDKNKDINFFLHDINNSKLQNKYDIIISSEVIEHCKNPKKALEHLCNSLNKEGYLILSTPNKKWEGLVKFASKIKIRPFQGYENFLTYNDIKEILIKNNFKILRFKGIHLYPFQFGFNKLHENLDNRTKFLNKFKINFAFLAQKTK